VSVAQPEKVADLAAADAVIGSKDQSDVKETKAYAKGEESTDDQASIRGGEESTDEGSSNSDGDSSQSSRKRTSALSSESPSRRASEASIAAPENIGELVPSVGSAGHFTGNCSRCCFFPKGRCNNGKNCSFCHFDHDRRPRRSKRGGKNKVDEESSTTVSEASIETEAKTKAATEVPNELAIEEPATPAPVVVKPPGLRTPPVLAAEPMPQPMVLPLPLPAFAEPIMPMPGALSHRMPPPLSHRMPLPMPYIPASFCPMPANLQPQEGQEAAHLRQVSGGRPVKVWLPESTCANKLERTIPAKKRPPYPELLTGARPALDPSMPAKKRVPIFSEGFLEGLFSQPMCWEPIAPAIVVPEAPAVLQPR